MKSHVFTLAWKFLKSNLFQSFAACLKAAWRAVQIKMGRVTEFTYTKADNSIRPAKSAPVPADYEFKTTERADGPANIIRYFDADALAFRSFDITRLST